MQLNAERQPAIERRSTTSTYMKGVNLLPLAVLSIAATSCARSSAPVVALSPEEGARCAAISDSVYALPMREMPTAWPKRFRVPKPLPPEVRDSGKLVYSIRILESGGLFVPSAVGLAVAAGGARREGGAASRPAG